MTVIANHSATFSTGGGTVFRELPRYIPRPADDALYTAVKRRELSYVFSARHMGKSSLMYRTANRLRDEGIAVVILDLTQVGVHHLTAEQWYIGMLCEVGRSLNLRREVMAYWSSNPSLSVPQRFFSGL